MVSAACEPVHQPQSIVHTGFVGHPATASRPNFIKSPSSLRRARRRRRCAGDVGRTGAEMASRSRSDEAYVIDLCDRILGLKARRQRRFPFLLGDPGRSGRRARLPVDAYYPELGLVVEYHERQHDEPVPFFDRRITAAGIPRGEQRRIYDERRRQVLPEQGLRLVVICCADLGHNGARRLLRDAERDERAIRAALEAAGVLFIEQNGNGPGVRLRDRK